MSVDLIALRSRPVAELVREAHSLGVEGADNLQKQELIFEIVRRRAGAGSTARGAGVLEILSDGFGFLRSSDANYLPGPDDIYVSPSQIRRFNLRTGDLVAGRVRAPKEGERYFALIKIERVNGQPPEDERKRPLFDNLTPVRPGPWLPLWSPDADPVLAVLDVLAPLARGARVLVRAAPRAGRTRLLRALIGAVAERHPDAERIVVLADERPEEVTEMRRAVDAEVLASTFDEPAARHVQVAEMALERARRIAEQGRHCLLVVDSLSRLARAYNETVAPSGRLLHGSVDPAGIHRARRALGAGRRLEEGGAITVVAAVLEGTGAPVDEVLAESLVGVANAEVALDADAAARGEWPAPDLHRTRAWHVEGLHPEEWAALARDVRELARADRDAALRHLLDGAAALAGA